jgi:hypothetical protein
MQFLLIIALLVALEILAARFGHDSRDDFGARPAGAFLPDRRSSLF